jgi:hypothetical protein
MNNIPGSWGGRKGRSFKDTPDGLAGNGLQQNTKSYRLPKRTPAMSQMDDRIKQAEFQDIDSTRHLQLAGDLLW